ncbi:MAG: hypothetical protein AAFY71_25465 [Bacteroidota bacterium]
MYLLRPLILSLVIFGSLFFVSCDSSDEAALAEIELDLQITRVDSMMWAYAQAYQKDTTINPYVAFNEYLGTEKAFLYEYLNMEEVARTRRLSVAYVDTLMMAQLSSVLKEKAMIDLLDTVREVFPYEEDLSSPLIKPLKRLKLAFPEIEIPAFKTMVNGYVPGGDMRTADQVVPLPNYISLGLHYLMGRKFPYYPVNISAYQKRQFDREALPVELMREIADGMVSPIPSQQTPNLLSGMIRAGIKQYFLEKMVPNSPDSLRLRYSAPQTQWAQSFEGRIYKELLDKMFSSDFKDQREYLSEKPYTTTLSMDSAPRIGEYCGWKIVQSYMKGHPEVSLADLCNMQDYEKILRESKYKPS